MLIGQPLEHRPVFLHKEAGGFRHPAAQTLTHPIVPVAHRLTPPLACHKGNTIGQNTTSAGRKRVLVVVCEASERHIRQYSRTLAGYRRLRQSRVNKTCERGQKPCWFFPLKSRLKFYTNRRSP